MHSAQLSCCDSYDALQCWQQLQQGLVTSTWTQTVLLRSSVQKFCTASQLLTQKAGVSCFPHQIRMDLTDYTAPNKCIIYPCQLSTCYNSCANHMPPAGADLQQAGVDNSSSCSCTQQQQEQRLQ